MALVTIPLNKAQPGLVVGEDILDPEGRVLIPRGARLTPLFIRRMEKWNIEEIVVMPAEDGAGEEEVPASVAAKSQTRIMQAPAGLAPADQQAFMRAVAEEAQYRFARVLDKPLMRDLMVLAVRRRIQAGPGGIPGVEGGPG